MCPFSGVTSPGRVWRKVLKNNVGWTGSTLRAVSTTSPDADGESGRQLVRFTDGGLIFTACSYWAIQAGLLTPLTFARHCLSPLAAFTSGAYFLHNGRR